MVITVHYKRKENADLVSTILDFKEFSGRHTGKRIKNRMIKTLKTFKLEAKVKYATTDNASSNVKAFNELHEITRLPCMAHKLHLTVTNGLCLWSLASLINDIEEAQLSESDTDTESETEEGDTASEDNEDEDIMNMEEEADVEDSWTEDIEEHVINNNLVLSTFVSGLKKVRSSVKQFSYPRMHVKLQKKLHQENSQHRALPENDCKTRWNSTYDMLFKFLRIRKAIKQVLEDELEETTEKTQKKKIRTMVVNDEEVEVLNDAVRLLSVFKSATELMSTQKYPTLGLGIGILKGLCEKSAEKEEDTEVMKALKKRINSSLTRYFYDDQGDLKEPLKSCFYTAAFLDPRLIGSLTPNEIKFTKSLLRKTMKIKSTAVKKGIVTRTVVQPSTSTCISTGSTSIEELEVLEGSRNTENDEYHALQVSNYCWSTTLTQRRSTLDLINIVVFTFSPS